MSPHAIRTEAPDVGPQEPIAICGMACRLPGGVNSESTFWQMLVEKRTGQTAKVPASRFNIDAHLHENLERPGSFNVPGGYFLDGRPEDFDPTFFNVTPVEAQWLDPQQRKMLEVTFECLTSAGLTLESVSGSNTAVFVGSFTSDYQQMSTREPDFRHNYAATGVDPGLISARIGNTFNLNGPSFTINTACSSSVYALHNACNSLRAGDCDGAIVGGVNLILTVDQHMNTAKLGILSPTSTCHTFDESADGYGRAEGVGALYVKRLSDAVRDNNPIRGVIRATAVNTNGKVPGMGITHPSIEGQERVVRMAYEKSQLDPNLTAYAELHGTGTPVGDPIEVRAISRALNDKRPSTKPLLVGAVKPNIGHSEAASGIFAVMKAALMTEAAVIPGVALLNKLNPDIHENEWNVKVNKDTSPWPSDFAVRRASVSSFGYGGTNGHVVIEAVESFYPDYRHGQPKRRAQYDHSTERPMLVCMSAHDKKTLARVVSDIAAVAPDYYGIDLAHTLNLHRTALNHRTFTILREGQEAAAFDNAAVMQSAGTVRKQAPRLAFLFTGQGAQWAGVGRVAMAEFPVFADVIHTLDRTLRRVKPAPSFRLADLLLGDPEETKEVISEPSVAQPLCTAIQIALVDLFAQWNVEPAVSVGHSSGEIAAAYAAGLVSASEAMLAAYCRGAAVQEHSGAGSMMAVGLGREEVEPWLPEDPAEVCIACENSPSSVTLSGRGEAIARLREALSAKGIFAREVGTGRAYHSPHMGAVAKAYEEMLEEAREQLSEDERFSLRPRSAMVSSITGELIAGDELPAGYFSQNLRQRVRFDEAVRALGADESLQDVNVALEIGPHSALAGPFKQICKAADMGRFSYVASMVRQKNDADQLLAAAGALFVAGYPLNLAEVNAPAYEGRGRAGLRKARTQYLLVDLPPYPWQYEREYWAEPRASAEQRALEYPRHDLLGGRVSGLSAATRAWRNVLRVRDVPWLHEHRLGGTAIFPAAGYLAMAIEAVRQVHETQAAGEDEGAEAQGQGAFQGVTLRDIEIKAPLAIPDREEEGVETLLTLKPAEAPGWHAFTVESCVNPGEWVMHCQGTVHADTGPADALSKRQARIPVVEEALGQHVPGRRWYDAFKRVGFEYGPAFQQLERARTERGVPQAAGVVTVRDTSDRVTGESRALVHPVTIDACLHLVIISVHAGRHREMPWGVVPTRIDEVAVAVPRPDDVAPAPGRAFAWTDARDGRVFNTHAQLLSQGRRTLVDIKNLTCVAYEAAVPVSAGDEAPPAPFSTVLWKPDLARCPADAAVSLLSDGKTGDELSKLVDLVAHRQPVANVLVVGCPPADIIDATLARIPRHATVKLGAVGDAAPALSEKAQGRVSVTSLGQDVADWASALGDETFDILVAEGMDPQQLLPLVNDEGWVLSKPDPSAQYGALQKRDEKLASKGDARPAITLVSFSDATMPWEGLVRALEATGSTVTQSTLVDFTGDADSHVVVDDTNGQFFSALNAKSFDGLKRLLASGGKLLWLTRGVQQGRSMVGGMAGGFLRVLGSEMAAARVALLDYSEDESLEALGRAAVDLVARADTRDSGADNEFWLDRGLLHISRLVPDDALNSDLDEEARLAYLETKPLPDPEDQVVKVRMLDGDVGVEPVEPVRALAPDEVEMRVDASQEPTTSQTGVFVVGKIVQAGSAVAETVIGQRAVGFITGELTTLARTSVFTTTPLGVEGPALSDESLLNALAPLPPLVDLTLGKTQLQAGHPLISLPGPLATMAAIAQIARAQGWDLSVVAATPEQRKQYEALSASSRLRVLDGDDIETLGGHLEAQSKLGYAVTVLAHDFSPLSREIWRRMPASGRFLLLNTEAAPVVPDATPFARGASFVATPASVKPSSSLLARCLREVEQHRDLVATQAQVSEVAEKPPVVSLHPGESKFKMVPPTTTCHLSSEAVYLLVGCLGGLGRSLTKRMMELGARHFAFISRSGADKPEAAAVVEGITRAGATAQVFRADAADEAATRRIVAQVAAERPLRGVVHAAMVLRDGMFERMDYETFEAAITPKARGAVALHRALEAVPGLPLDFFVLTSSISALLGNTGQSNYAAANGALESLARFRVARGWPATALVLPMVLDVGVVAEADGLEESLLRKGLYGIDEYEMLRGIERAMTHGAGSPLVLGMEAAALGRVLAAAPADSLDLYWYRDARFCHVRKAIEAAGRGGAGGAGGGGSLAEALQTAQAEGGQPAVLRTIAAHIAKRVSIILMIPVEDIELEGPSIASYGLDSMIGAEMRTWLFKEFSLDYPFQQLLAPDLSFTKLAKVVADKMGVL